MNGQNNQLSVVSDNKFASSSILQPYLVKLKCKTVNLLITTTSILSTFYVQFTFIPVITILLFSNVTNNFWNFLYNDVHYILYVVGFLSEFIKLICSKNLGDNLTTKTKETTVVNKATKITTSTTNNTNHYYVKTVDDVDYLPQTTNRANLCLNQALALISHTFVKKSG